MTPPERFDDYMERCLYHPRDGFYAEHGSAGRAGGDFVTSPEVGSLFGAVLARAVDRWWIELGSPDRFVVVEAGAGRGSLARSILHHVEHCAAALDYVVVERSDRLRVEAAGDDRVRAVADLGEVASLLGVHEGGMVGVVLANELLDNLPFRLVRVAPGDGAGSATQEEVWVTDGRPVLGVPTAADPRLARLRVPTDGALMPLFDRAALWIRQACSLLAAGRVVVFDYGVRHSQELVERQWLRTYQGHRRGGDPFEAPGRSDITADIAFDQLPEATRIETQAEFLEQHRIADLVERARLAWREGAATGDLAAMAARSRVGEAEALTDPTGLGGFLVAQWMAAGNPDAGSVSGPGPV
ncbi:MAG: SAM-dependent methyltransferase [Microthrixaceae bacterium]